MLGLCNPHSQLKKLLNSSIGFVNNEFAPLKSNHLELSDEFLIWKSDELAPI